MTATTRKSASFTADSANVTPTRSKAWAPGVEGEGTQAGAEAGEGLEAPSILSGQRQPLHRCVTEALEHYFETLDGETPVELYELVIDEVERPLLTFVMKRVCGNQSRAAQMLGLNRGTLRKKLKQHGLLER